jgi:hypothetical protein
MGSLGAAVVASVLRMLATERVELVPIGSMSTGSNCFVGFHEKFDLQRQVKSSTTKPNKLNYYSRDRALSRYDIVRKLAALEAVMHQATVFLADGARVLA